MSKDSGAEENITLTVTNLGFYLGLKVPPVVQNKQKLSTDHR